MTTSFLCVQWATISLSAWLTHASKQTYKEQSSAIAYGKCAKKNNNFRVYFIVCAKVWVSTDFSYGLHVGKLTTVTVGHVGSEACCFKWCAKGAMLLGNIHCQVIMPKCFKLLYESCHVVILPDLLPSYEQLAISPWHISYVIVSCLVNVTAIDSQTFSELITIPWL